MRSTNDRARNNAERVLISIFESCRYPIMLDAIRQTPPKTNTQKHGTIPPEPTRGPRVPGWFARHKELFLWIGMLVSVGLVLGIWIYWIKRSPVSSSRGTQILGSSDLTEIQSSLNTLFQDVTHQWTQIQKATTPHQEPTLNQEALQKLADTLASLEQNATTTPSITPPNLP